MMKNEIHIPEAPREARSGSTDISREMRLTLLRAATALITACQLAPCSGQSIQVIEQQISRRLPDSTKLLNFTKISGTQRGIVILDKKGEGRDGDALACSVGINGNQIEWIGKPTALSYCLVKPRVVRLDVDGDGRLELAVICNAGGAHALEYISVLKYTTNGVKNLTDALPLAYEWKVIQSSKARTPILVADIEDQRTLRFAYSKRQGKYVKSGA